MDVLYSDKNLIICVKPVGVDSEAGLPELIKSEFGGEVYTVHRLDMNVGGVMVYARNKQTAAALSKSVAQGDMIKEYVACVEGIPPKSGVLEDLLFKDSRKNKVFAVKRMRKGVKTAKLEYVRLNDSDPSLVRIRLHTGRSHQIRVQFASRGYPLVGDHKYGSKSEQKSPLLYSSKITFPYKGEVVSFESLPLWAAE
ncbi:MAG: RNA pseudouridine synthase [Ruminococcus sp.]|nr:RNA pseudouridine synthase [Ruminococcus sp.]